ncbi:MAG: TIGR00725 family protein [Promethearchaeota archaeon]
MSFNFKDKFRGTVSIIGASEIDEKTRQIAIELGRLLARNNYAVSCGGLSGVMEAVCQGAKEEGGLTIGIIPFKDKNRANEYVDIVIPVPFSQARNIVVVLSGDVCVAVAGKAGTLSEICFAWIYEKPIICLTCVEGWSSKMAGQQLDDRRKDKIHGVDSSQAAIDKLNEIFTQNKFNPIKNI